jgi:predicted kinase
VEGRRLLIVCGIPGSGKSTFALRAAERWDAVKFASETFAEQLGAAARTASGDLTKEAIVHAYSAMGAAGRMRLRRISSSSPWVRSDRKNNAVAFAPSRKSSGASVTTLRVVCPVETAAKRISARLALGERGPDEKAIRQIQDGLNGAADIDLVLTNDSSIEDFCCRIDALLESLIVAASAKANDRNGRMVV